MKVLPGSKEVIAVISKVKMERFRDLRGHSFWQKSGTNIVDNVRTVLPLNERTVGSSFPVV